MQNERCTLYVVQVIYDLFTVAAEEIDLSTVRVVVIIPELTVKSPLFGAKEPSKNCTVEITPETRYYRPCVNAN